MKNFGRILLAGALMSLAAAGVQADEAGDKYFSVLGSYVDADGDRQADTGYGLAGSLGWVLNESWDIEVIAGYATVDGDVPAGDLDQIYLGGNMLNVYRRGTAFQPYWMLGLGMVSSDADINGGSDENLYGQAGVGAFTPIAGDKIRLRYEILTRWENDSDVYQDWFVNLGVYVPFGRKSEPAPAAVVVVDTDGDGVPDAVDQCPNTPAGAEVDETGCELDSDGDGVPDRLDQCPNTPPGATVDENGCEIDSDGDGVVDSRDECPNTPPNTEVDNFGCPFPTIIKLPEVNFRTNSAMLLDGAGAALAAAAATLIQNPGLQVEVAGHTDSQGDAGYNRKLSQQRAESVRQYLITAGVDEHRISARGYGEDEPIADNSTPEGMAQNRRVELRVLSD